MKASILYPLFALSGWTLLILVLIAYRRIGAGLAGRVKPADFRFGESAAVPPEVCLPNRNYMNLLELPVLFYVVGLIGYLAKGTHFFGDAVSPEIVTAASVPVAILVVWWLVRRVRRSHAEPPRTAGE